MRDGRLYVSEQDGTVNVLSVHRRDSGRYGVLAHERIESIAEIPNHDDQGAPVATWGTLFRLVGKRLGVCCEHPQKSPPPVSSLPPTGAGDPARGAALFRDAGCVGCHAFAPAGSTAQIGPGARRAVVLPVSYLEQSILEPDAVIVPGYPADVMPDYGRTVSEQQLRDLVAYIRTKPGGG